MIRRRFFQGLAAATVILPTGALALTEAGAKQLIDALVGDINSVISSGKSQSAMNRDFERIFARYSDTAYISAYAMGVDARRATNAQKRAFSDAFQSYVSRKYGKRFREFQGGRLEVRNVKAVKNWYEVQTIAYLPGQAPFEVTFHVSDRTGRNLFFNMYIEGINMLLSERAEIGALLDRNGGDIDRMIAALQQAG